MSALLVYGAYLVSGQPEARAEGRGREYLDALQAAQKKVERTQRAQTSPGAPAWVARHAAILSPSLASNARIGDNALSSAIIVQMLGRMYRVGESWEVAATQFDPTAMRKTSDPKALQRGKGRTGIFRYEVIEVKTTPVPEITLQVTQLEGFGAKPIDPRVEQLRLTMNDKTQQTKKAYRFRRHAEAVTVAPDGLRSAITALELFPLDVPEIETADAQEAKTFPELPARLQQIRSEAPWQVVPAHSLWFEQDDPFGRPIRALWQQGDPWPAYLETSQGIAILLKRRTS